MIHNATRRPIGLRAGRTVLWLWLLALVVVLRPDAAPRLVRAGQPSTARDRGPNLLIIVADDHRGGTLGIDGDPRQATPRLDTLARQGARFTRAYCNSPLCTPSRQSFITGRLPHAVGVTRLATRLPDDAVTLADWLRNLGYDTAAIGKMHFNSPNHHGFNLRVDLPDWERWLRAHPPAGGDQRRKWRPFEDPAAIWLNAHCEPLGLPASAMDSTYFADRAIEFLEARHDQPFLLVVGFYDPHSPFHFPREWMGRYKPRAFSPGQVTPADLQDQPRVFKSLSPDNFQGIQAAYYTSLSFLDSQVGRVLDALDATGLDKDTIVVYLGDNGYMLGEHARFEKHTMYEPAVRVPFLARWPRRIPADRRVDDMVELVDLFPTLLDLAGIAGPTNLHGKSLAPLLRGDSGARGHEVVVSEYLENEEAMARSDRYKLVVGNGRVPRTDGYRSDLPVTGPYEHLYDMLTDPGEAHDLAAQPALAPVKAALRHSLYLRLTSTRDGIAPVPAGLSEAEAICWCLIPRDKVVESRQANRSNRASPSE